MTTEWFLRTQKNSSTHTPFKMDHAIFCVCHHKILFPGCLRRTDWVFVSRNEKSNTHFVGTFAVCIVACVLNVSFWGDFHRVRYLRLAFWSKNKGFRFFVSNTVFQYFWVFWICMFAREFGAHSLDREQSPISWRKCVSSVKLCVPLRRYRCSSKSHHFVYFANVPYQCVWSLACTFFSSA
jgi:hypothetical protein